jgi:hypothetical protein
MSDVSFSLKTFLVFLCDIQQESTAEVVWISNNKAEAYLNILSFTQEKRKSVEDLRKAENRNRCPPPPPPGKEAEMTAITLLSQLDV